MADPTYTYIWGFQDFNPIGRNTADPDEGLVTEIHWKLTATSSDSLSAESIGFVTLTKGDTVIPFEDLTKSTIINWVKNKTPNLKIPYNFPRKALKASFNVNFMHL